MMPPVQSRLATAGVRRRRVRVLLHRVRAFQHHIAALLREFRGPILGFVGVTVLGGFLYGELYERARGTSIPLIDRPYVMVQLMLLETPESVPAEWYLVIFWYLLPPLFIVLVGLGAADFVDLFFNRADERDAWGEALARSYRSHAIVLGAGHVGLRVVRDLVDMGIEVVVVDNAPDGEALESLEAMGVPVVRGDGRRTAILDNAGIRHAEAFVACTADDHTNLEAVIRAREMSEHVRIVARFWERSAFGRQLERSMGVHSVLSAADLSAPAFAGAAAGVEITQTLEIHGVEYSTALVRVHAASFLEGRTVGELQREEGVEVVLLGRDGQSLLDPPHETPVRNGEDLVLFARHSQILDVVARNRRRGRLPVG